MKNFLTITLPLITAIIIGTWKISGEFRAIDTRISNEFRAMDSKVSDGFRMVDGKVSKVQVNVNGVRGSVSALNDRLDTYIETHKDKHRYTSTD